MTASIPPHSKDQRRAQWITWMDEISNDVARWSQDARWLVHRKQKTLHEKSIGTYEAPVVEIKTPSGHLIVEPVALEVFGAEARIDLYAWPSLNRVKLIRVNGAWKLRTDSGIDWPKPWSKEV